MSSERVLVVPTELFHALGHFQGFRHEASRYLAELLKAGAAEPWYPGMRPIDWCAPRPAPLGERELRP